jgi:hypothetical protein
MVARRTSVPPTEGRAKAAGTAASAGARPELALRPLLRARHVSLFEREVRERLTRSAVELLFGAAEVISEGQRTTRGGSTTFAGSTMLTIELRKLAGVLREAADARAAQRLAALLGRDAGARARARAIAHKEVERLAGARPRALEAEVRVRARGTTVFVDVDVEASL